MPYGFLIILGVAKTNRKHIVEQNSIPHEELTKTKKNVLLKISVLQKVEASWNLVVLAFKSLWAERLPWTFVERQPLKSFGVVRSVSFVSNNSVSKVQKNMKLFSWCLEKLGVLEVSMSRLCQENVGRWNIF